MMTRILNTLVLLATLCVSASALANSPTPAAQPVQASQSLVGNVNGMVCSFCAQGIEKKFKAMKQTQDVYVNLPKNIVAVQLKAGQTMSEKEFTAAIVDAGYDVTKVHTTNKTTAQLKQEYSQDKAKK